MHSTLSFDDYWVPHLLGQKINYLLYAATTHIRHLCLSYYRQADKQTGRRMDTPGNPLLNLGISTVDFLVLTSSDLLLLMRIYFFLFNKTSYPKPDLEIMNSP